MKGMRKRMEMRGILKNRLVVISLIFICSLLPIITQFVSANAEENVIYANEFVDAKKQIDYLGDGEKNPDTMLSGEDFYRLYMDVEGTTVFPSMDVTLVIDTSASMGRYKLGSRTRIEGLRDVLLGSPTYNFLGFINGRKNDGIIDMIYKLNDKNRISVKSYGPRGVSHTGLLEKKDMNWLKNSVPRATKGGTNIEDGLYYAHKEVTSAESKDVKRKQVVILLSDGEPTHFNAPLLAPFFLNTFEGGMFTWTLGSGRSGLNALICKYPTINATNEFKSLHPKMDLYTVFIANQYDWYANKDVMNKIASTPNFSFNAQDINALRSALMKCLGIMKDIYITDELSEYVDYYTAKDDLKVTIKRPNGKTSTLSSQEYDVIKKPSQKGEKSVQIKIKNGLEIDSVYTVSFNIAVSDMAKSSVDSTKEGLEFYGSGGRLGDKNTDFYMNKTSSGQPGFPSNKKATVTWARENNIGGIDNYEVLYDHPVVQVKKHEPIYDPKVVLKKEIDYLGDGVNNVHTNLGGKSDYRLYLSVENTTDKPIHLVKPLQELNITDYLSKNVIFNRLQPDLIVERTVNNVTSVVPNDEYTVNIIKNSVDLKVTKGQPLNSKITLSFNINVNNKQSIIDWENNNFAYPHIGDLETDYLTNLTSSNQPGFFSNSRTTQAKWIVGGQATTGAFPHPVVQLSEEDASNGSVTRAIMKLDEKKKNEDTEVTDSNYLRVYAELHSNTNGKEDEVIPLVKASYQDEMSKYTNLDKEKIDLKVTLVDEGVAKLVSSKDYKVVYGEDSLEVKLDKSVPNNGKLTVSYNVKVNNDTIIEDWLENDLNYPDIGDENTDYGEEKLSSNQPGFAISKKSVFKWTEAITEQKEVTTPMPVVQANTEF
ncbi:vWA domain-containing protein [Enterococcus faecalis]|uniref:vWA domain-containing protein n=1 Tax=Enterococcus faecalis TaxID=1351 RepID=UPI0025B091E0|nr:vWA domain-containing protein [Enterococcus faecalis]MDN3185479.1 VWA domain-containing protein [Enterococcus faecalis]